VNRWPISLSAQPTDHIETVSEAEIARPPTYAWSTLKLIVEPERGRLAAALRPEWFPLATFTHFDGFNLGQIALL